MTKDEALDLALEALEGMDILFSPLSRDCTQYNAIDRARKAITAIKQARSAPVQVSPLEFVTMVMEKEHLVGKPLFWAEWPNKENT
jgi:hypothetical protein